MGKPTECVRAMLDERDIYWWAGESEDQTRWKGSGLTWEFEEGIGRAFLGACENDVTPEQAIAATLCEYTYEQWRAINEIVGNAMEYAHDVAIMHPDKADPCWDLSNYVDQILEVAFDKHEHEGEQMMNATNAVDEILTYIVDTTSDFDTKERIMVLCTVSEHCKAYEQTILAHEYHAALYGRKKANE